MSVALDADDLKQLVAIVKKLPGFDNERDRRRLLMLTLGGTPRADTILNSVDVSGAPMFVATGWITRLADLGQMEYGKEALGIFLNAITPYVETPTISFIHAVLSKYSLVQVQATCCERRSSCSQP
jgi:hypothetical protein